MPERSSVDTRTSETSPLRYRRLTRWKSGIGLFYQSSIVIDAGDHLLSVKRIGYREISKRLYYKDIQAIVCLETPTGTRVSLVLGMLAALFAFASILLWQDQGLFRFSTMGSCSVAVVLGAVVLLNAWKGPTCVCVVHTAVQAEVLGSVTRLSVARRVLPLIRLSIEDAQGAIELNTVLEHFRAGRVSNVGGKPQKRQTWDSGKNHLVAFGFLLLLGGLHLATWGMIQPRGALFLQTSGHLFVALMMVRTLILQRNTMLAAGLQTFTWTAFVVTNLIGFARMGYANLLVTFQLLPAEEVFVQLEPSVIFNELCAIVYMFLGGVGLVVALLYGVGRINETMKGQPEEEDANDSL